MRISHRLSVPAQIVLDALADPNRVRRWLPDGATVERHGDVWWISFAGDRQEYRTRRDNRTVTWEPVGAGWAGAATVQDGPAGASILNVQVRGVPAAADELVDTVLRRLEADVTENPTDR
jgi:hypothetical protein